MQKYFFMPFIFFILFAFSKFSLSQTLILDQFSWTKLDDHTGKVLSIKAHAYMGAGAGGPCAGSTEWKSGLFHKYKCSILLGDPSLHNNVNNNKMVMVFNSNRSIASDTPVVLDSVNSLVGKEFPIEGGTNVYACLFEDSVSPYSTVFSGLPFACNGKPIPPVPNKVYCKLTKQVNINYGVVKDDEINGLKKSATTELICNGDATVEIKVKNSTKSSNVIYLRDDKSISSKLTVDGKDTSSTGIEMKMKANAPQNVVINSELISSGSVNAGEFRGAGIAVISIQ
ncbi:hypothetical protein A6A26_24075 (plasmid) [Pantoea sp. OXWO6B1]|nr:hypothetical protein A6A26_24075 [Pantoea sp. OXWO6B1]